MQNELFPKTLKERIEAKKKEKAQAKEVPVFEGEKIVVTSTGLKFKLVEKYDERNYKYEMPQFTMKELQVIKRSLEMEGREKLTEEEMSQIFRLKLMFRGTVVEQKTMRDLKGGKVLNALEAKDRIREMREALKKGNSSSGLDK